MRTIQQGALGVMVWLLAAISIPVTAEESTARKEMKRTDLSGAPGMEVISSIVEYRTGDIAVQHFHHDVETAYVIQGSMIQLPGKEAMMLETGTVVLNLRDVVHGGFKVVGDKPLRLFTAHIVDKGKPLYSVPLVPK